MDGRTGCKQAKGGWARRAGHSRGIIAGQDRTGQSGDGRAGEAEAEAGIAQKKETLEPKTIYHFTITVTKIGRAHV